MLELNVGFNWMDEKMGVLVECRAKDEKMGVF